MNRFDAQGEVLFRRIEALPDMGMLTTHDIKQDKCGDWIVSHSEQGNDHVLERDAIESAHLAKVAPKGIRILYAIVKKPGLLKQNAANAHGAHELSAGIYEMRTKREFDPLLKQARQVAD